MSIRKRRTTRAPKVLRKLLKRLNPVSKHKYRKWLKTTGNRKLHKAHQDAPEPTQPAALLQSPKPVLYGAEETSILTAELAEELTPSLPFTYRRQAWEKVFSTEKDGYNLNTIYARVQESKVPSRTTSGCLVVLKTLAGDVLGAFSSTPLQLSDCFRGNGECFVFKSPSDLKCFHGTGNNLNYIMTKPDFMAFGGGGEFALYLDSALEKGTSEVCTTYDNEPLASENLFRCAKLEVWCFRNPFLQTPSNN